MKLEVKKVIESEGSIELPLSEQQYDEFKMLKKIRAKLAIHRNHEHEKESENIVTLERNEEKSTENKDYHFSFGDTYIIVSNSELTIKNLSTNTEVYLEEITD